MLRATVSVSNGRRVASHPYIHLVGGKGGVGKTTCAAALAVASANRGARTLVISTDPAPNLGDALKTRLNSAPRRVPCGGGALDAVEIDARAALRRWLRGRRRALETIALRGTWLDSDDVSRLLRASLPGIDEIAALFEIARFSRVPRYDLIVVDTAPTGHTLRMLAMPQTLQGVANAFDHMQEKHRVMIEALIGHGRRDEADRFIEHLKRDAAALRSLLVGSGADVTLVTTAEPMATAETLDAARSLAMDNITIARVIVNKMTPMPPQPCAWCLSRRRFEQQAIATLPAAWRRSVGGRLPVVATIDTRTREPIGVRALAGIAAEFDRRLPKWRTTARQATRVPTIASVSGVECDPVDVSAVRLIVVGGKGGVGKTTCAAAVALDAAARHRGRRVLLLSVDPAHSLADVLGSRAVAGSIKGGPGNLSIRELDAAAGLRRLRARYARAIDAIFDRVGAGSAVDMAHDRRVLHDFINLAPPGLDELIAILEVTESLAERHRNEPDLVVMDTAPTGHALRLLEMPALVHEWTKTFMHMLLKYRSIAEPGELGEILLAQSQALGRLRALLTDPERTKVVVVTRAAALPRLETGRLMGSLTRLGMDVPAVVINAVGQGSCSNCRRERRQERRELGVIARMIHSRTTARVFFAPASVPPPRGARMLVRWRRHWRARCA
jgi:arsenite-transporting ATPase